MVNKSILKTLVYADIFGFPMNDQEIYKYLISQKSFSFKGMKKELGNMVCSGQIGEEKGLYFLRGKSSLVGVRMERLLESRRKTKDAYKIARILGLIPTISLISISGSLSMENSDKKDDIDLFIVAKAGTLWLTRFLVHSTLFFYKLSGAVQDKICPNMYLPENNLKISSKKRNLFVAHEVAQLKVILNRGSVYEKFLSQNFWVKKYLPNFEIKKSKKAKFSFSVLFSPLDNLLYLVQFIYMKSKIVKEEVGKDRIMFHDKDKGGRVLELYDLKLSSLSKKARNFTVSFHDFEAKAKAVNTPGY